RYVRDVEAGGSNPLTPTRFHEKRRLNAGVFSFVRKYLYFLTNLLNLFACIAGSVCLSAI
ncbi:hypothetical protein, partial [Niveibacterium sp.]|uniref:hypothetical protein n=1 Tax=Niveibacterium sp. TaxID=2017444 RepID=UPI0035B29435